MVGSSLELVSHWRERAAIHAAASKKWRMEDGREHAVNAMLANAYSLCADELEERQRARGVWQRHNNRALAALCWLAFTAGALAGWLGARQ